MNRKVLSILVFLLSALVCFAQTDRHEVRSGNRQFSRKHWRASEIEYLKGLAKDSTSLAASYNLSSALYREQKYDEAGKTLQMGAEAAELSPSAAEWHFNAGDIALQKQDYRTAVDEFKKSLLLRPGDYAAKENYTYARMKLEEQQNQDQNQQDQNQQDQNQNQNQNDQNQDQNQNQNDQNQDQNQQQPPQDQDSSQDQQPSEPPKISPQQAQQMLSAIQAKEKETQDKVNKEKAALLQSRQKDKNW